MYDILLVDFSRRLCGELQQMLLRSKAQYTIANCVFSSAEALTALSERDFSLVMVHTERFDTAGLWLCNDIRKKSDTYPPDGWKRSLQVCTQSLDVSGK